MSNKIKKILLVEDELTLSEMYKTKFKREGFDVVVLGSGEVVFETAKKIKPNIILLDVILPKIDGFAVLKELKKNVSTKKIPVIMLTNLGQDEDKKKGKDLGAEDYVVKADSTPAQVLERVEKVLKK